MYTQTKNQIVEIIKKNEQIQVKDLVRELSITPAAVHRALNKLIQSEVIEKKGTPPRVFYSLKITTNSPPLNLIQLEPEQEKILSENYMYITPTGSVIEGLDGFLTWMRVTKNQQKIENCVKEYIQVYNEANSYKDRLGIINATERFQKIFHPCYLNQVYYYDFYSLVKFGKTRTGQLLLNGKQSQNKKIIFQLSQTVKSAILNICHTEKINAIAWAPHSIPRKIQFLNEMKKNLKLNLPTIQIVKVYQGTIPIAQKSLSKMEERIQNARETMVVIPLSISYKNVLLIDDAVGSGSTLNELAQKLKNKGARSIIGFSIVGSYKDFEVIREV